jgi:hypothetical protein
MNQAEKIKQELIKKQWLEADSLEKIDEYLKNFIDGSPSGNVMAYLNLVAEGCATTRYGVIEKIKALEEREKHYARVASVIQSRVNQVEEALRDDNIQD